MKLLYIVDRFPTASETFVAEEIRGMKARGHEVTIVSLKRPDPASIGRMGPGLRSFISITHYVSRAYLPAILRYGASRGAWRLNKRIRNDATTRVRPLPRLIRAMIVADIVRTSGAEWIHAHWPRPTEVAILASEMTGCPFSVSIHAHEVAHDAGHFPAAFESLRFATFCNSAAMKLLLASLPPEANDRSYLVYHGVDLSGFTQSAMPPLADGLRVASAGRLTKTKGFDRLIRAIALARSTGVDASLSIFGEGGERASLEALISDLGVGDAVSLPGWIPHEMMSEELSQHHLFALMADDTFHDGLPNVVLEAMALGRPAMLSPIPAAAEAVSSGRNGLILQTIDGIDEAARTLGWFVEHPKRLAEIGREAADSIHAKHDKAQHLDRLDALFRTHQRGAR